MNEAQISLEEALQRALAARTGLVERLRAEETDCWRMFHGVVEGRPGLTIDRYGELVLVQTFRAPIESHELATIERVIGGPVVWNHRGPGARAPIDQRHADVDLAEREHVVRERGVRFSIRARHRGIDPWLFLDLRAGRRALTDACRGKSVLNLFAYTGAAGIAALVHGASEAWNVDFARSSSSVSARHAELNGLDASALTTIVEDVFPIVRQLAGLAVKGRASARSYMRVTARGFGVVFLDPPAFAKGPFGTVDVEHDYQSLFKPALLALEDGGLLIATNHVAAVSIAEWRTVLERCAEKAGRPLAALEFIAPDADFPSPDGRAPLKIALCRV